MLCPLKQPLLLRRAHLLFFGLGAGGDEWGTQLLIEDNIVNYEGAP